MQPVLLAKPATSPRFSGDTHMLETIVMPALDTQKPEALYDDLYVKRTDPRNPQEGTLEDRIMGKLMEPAGRNHTLITGMPGAGKSMVMNKLERDLQAVGVPVQVTNGMQGWDELNVFLAQHRDKPRTVLMAKEIGLALKITDDGQFLTGVELLQSYLNKTDATGNSLWPNLVIVADTEALGLMSQPSDIKQKYEEVFGKNRFVVPLPTKAETLTMVDRVLQYAGFTGIPQKIKDQFQASNISIHTEGPRHYLLEVITALRNKAKAEGVPRQESRDIIETIPETVLDTIFQTPPKDNVDLAKLKATYGDHLTPQEWGELGIPKEVK